LATILIVAANQENNLGGFWLLLFYSFGLGIPFILAGVLINSFLGFFNIIKKHFKIIEIISGSLLILVGIALVLKII
jgi:cytochrome c-type biogenesis protein